MHTRRVYRLSGADTQNFLQNLVTNDVSRIDDGLVYAALLTPQGKFCADFFIWADEKDVLLDVDARSADSLLKRLNMYRLRVDVTIAETALNLHRGTGTVPAGAFPDPRHPALGWRAYSEAPESDDGSDWTALRVANCVPEYGMELGPESYILEMEFERLNGVDFRKGCYVGQEVTARMKHKTTLRKGLRIVNVDGVAEPGIPIFSGGKQAGMLHSRSGNRAIAYLRFGRVTECMRAGDAVVTLAPEGQ